MRPYPSRVVAVTMVLVAALATSVSGQTRRSHSSTTSVEGAVYDATTREPIPFATVQVVGTGRSTLTNNEGRFRILVKEGWEELKFSHIAYYSSTARLEQIDTATAFAIHLQPTLIELGGITTYNVSLDPGQRIITEAIKRKRDILNHIRDYRFDAYTKLVIRDLKQPDSSHTGDSAVIWMLTETQSTSFWQQPDRYMEVITARRQSANLTPEDNLVTVGEILNFNRDRVEVGRFAMVSPTARDALDHYDYYLVDTVLVDSLRVFRLEIEPRNPDEPLFVGSIHIADSSYDVVNVDVGFSRGAHFLLVTDVRYEQRFARFDDDYWMPIKIQLTGRIEFRMPIPGIPKRLGIAHIASLHDYTFDAGHPKGLFDEIAIEVADGADDIDSLAWLARQAIPLTVDEVRAYERIDSVSNIPPSVGKVLFQGTAAGLFVLMGGAPDFFQFNRAEGAYLGAGGTLRPGRKLDLRLKGGYAFGVERIEWLAGATYRLHERRRFDVGFDITDRIVARPSIATGPQSSPSGAALLYGMDPFDYYRAQGFDAFAAAKLVNFTRLTLTYHDYLHFSAPVATDYTMFERSNSPRGNPPITNGKLRSLEAELQIDTRPMFKSKGRTEKIGVRQYTQFTLGVEHASPDLIDNDFEFTRYHASLYRRQRTLGLGVTTLRVYAGASDNNLPPQRYFHQLPKPYLGIGLGGCLLLSTQGFNTLDETVFVGNRIFAVSFDHKFKRRLFVKSGLPLLKDIPLWLSIHGGVFWSEFRNQTAELGNTYHLTAAQTPYQELGFTLGNLTPFLSPFNFAVGFTWQLSDYPTSDFIWFLDLQP